MENSKNILNRRYLGSGKSYWTNTLDLMVNRIVLEDSLFDILLSKESALEKSFKTFGDSPLFIYKVVTKKPAAIYNPNTENLEESIKIIKTLFESATTMMKLTHFTLAQDLLLCIKILAEKCLVGAVANCKTNLAINSKEFLVYFLNFYRIRDKLLNENDAKALKEYKKLAKDLYEQLIKFVKDKKRKWGNYIANKMNDHISSLYGIRPFAEVYQ